MSAIRDFLNTPRGRGLLYQSVTVAGTLVLAAYLVSNTLHNLSARGIATGLDFLTREAGFDVSESLIPFTAANSYGRALLAGIGNTLLVSVLGVALATVLGVLLGIARLSTNWVINRLAVLYVEAVRNVPLLLQLTVWYAAMMVLPGPRDSFQPLPHIFLNNRGLRVPFLADHPANLWIGLAVLVGVAAAWGVVRYGLRRRALTGRSFPLVPAGLAALILPAFAVVLISGAPLTLEMPELAGFNFVGGVTLSPEFTALLVGLVTYTAGFIAEIVRSGIQSVPRGQTEAAQSIGLRPSLTLRLVILPQALRVIIPPLTSQYLNLTKNSSLAVAIGYPDLVSVTNTTANVTGQVVEAVALMMAVYLTISLSIAAFMNWYNKKMALVTR